MNDPDGDRFGMATVKNNKLKLLNPNIIARIFALYFLKIYNKSELVFVNTFLCDDFFENFCKKLDLSYKRTQTGFKNIINGVRELLN
jgi:phosphomannomutase